MHVVHVAAECFPFAKVGGLGDVIHGLSREQAKLGMNVTVILPCYQTIDTSGMKRATRLSVIEKKKKHLNTLWETSNKDVSYIFIEPDNDYFQRDEIYGYDDDILRFLYFSRATFDLISNYLNRIDILHIHDWHSSALAPLYQGVKDRPKIILTISNGAYQGICRPFDLNQIGLDGEALLKSGELKDKNPELVNLLKGGIVFSDSIVAVSPTYAQELLTNSYGLEQTFMKYQNKLAGILNGIDPIIWNPATDRALIKQYDNKESAIQIVQAKKENRKILSQRLLLEENPQKPLIANIGRLVPQKGPDLIIETIYTALENGGQFVLLGSSPTKEIEHQFQFLKNEFKENANIAFCFVHDEDLARLIYAASDFIIIPSLFEPCGLTQLIALRYGTIPIARKTGGLADTIFDLEDPFIPIEKRNGFSFSLFDRKEIQKTVKRAIIWWKEHSDSLAPFLSQIMQIDYSWQRSAKEYSTIYYNLISSFQSEAKKVFFK